MKDRTTGRVIGHTRVLASALPVTLPVQPAGHAKVIETGHKNVHAFVRGDWLIAYADVDGWQAHTEACKMIPVSYNPYRGPSFYRKDTGADIAGAQSIVMIAKEGAPPYVAALF